MPSRIAIFCALLVAGFSFAGCQVGAARSTSNRRNPEAASTDATDLSSARTGFEKAVSLASTPQEKARAYLSLGRVHLAAGQPRSAVKCFYEARKTFYQEPLTNEINLAIGDGYYELEDYSLARRYLQKSVEATRGPERERVTARLVICCRATDDVAAATAYRGKLSQPFAAEVQDILSTEIEPASHVDDVRQAVAVDDGNATDEAPRHSAGRDSSSDGVEKLRVYSRQSWNARAPRPNIEPMGHVDKITIHHTGGEDFWSGSASDAAAEIRKIQRYHQNDQGWADIGYHYIVDRSGAIWQGRRIRYQGAHARGSANNGNIGIVLLGNFTHQQPTAAQRDSLTLLLETLCEHFGLAPTSVYTHREILNGKTECPGPALSRCVDQIRLDLRRRLVAYRP
jgi:tetratricopeptide (TPR) repeat protein